MGHRVPPPRPLYGGELGVGPRKKSSNFFEPDRATPRQTEYEADTPRDQQKEPIERPRNSPRAPDRRTFSPRQSLPKRDWIDTPAIPWSNFRRSGNRFVEEIATKETVMRSPKRLCRSPAAVARPFAPGICRPRRDFSVWLRYRRQKAGSSRNG